MDMVINKEVNPEKSDEMGFEILEAFKKCAKREKEGCRLFLVLHGEEKQIFINTCDSQNPECLFCLLKNKQLVSVPN